MNIQEMKLAAKGISIVGYLSSIGFEPVRKNGTTLRFHSPLRPDKDSHPSFDVDTVSNRWKDWGEDDRWWNDIIKLVQKVENCGFSTALSRLSIPGASFTANPFVFPKGMTYETCRSEPKIKVLEVYPLATGYLIQYITRIRRIPITLANLYLSEALVYNTNSGKKYPAIAFKTDAGSYELRSQFVKVAAGKKAITTIPVQGSTELNIFEGFINFLSHLVHSNLLLPEHTTVVLNGTGQLDSAIPLLKNFQTINSFVDLGTAGRIAHKKILNAHDHVIDQSFIIHPKFEDFNDFLQNKYPYEN